MLCESCGALVINGVLCHEHGCPDAWKDYKRECRFCGSEFTPGERYDLFCSHSCLMAYHGIACDCEECQ